MNKEIPIEGIEVHNINGYLHWVDDNGEIKCCDREEVHLYWKKEANKNKLKKLDKKINQL